MGCQSPKGAVEEMRNPKVEAMRARVKRFEMSKKAQKMNRQQRAAAKRQLIVGSSAFSEWWMARQTFYPIPSEPYRAFMIDLGLYARPHHKEVWKHRTNRLDYPPIDFPRRGEIPKGIPRKRRRLPSRKEIKRWKKVPKRAQPIIMTPYEKKLVKEVEKMTEEFHIPMPKVKFHPRTSARYVPTILPWETPSVILAREFVATGAPKKRKREREQVMAALRHEVGHHVHAAYGGARVKMPKLASIITAPYKLKGLRTRKETQETERIAWGIARARKPFTTRQAWLMKTYLGTYLGTTPYISTIWG
jgi:hypothetical protein